MERIVASVSGESWLPASQSIGTVAVSCRMASR
jgi:hypothetical protein